MINTTTDSAQTTANPAAPAKDKSGAATAASDFQSFLKLLTAQLRNQDPLSPLDSTQFVEQLASFSAVEQQIQTNTLLKEMIEGAAGSPLEQAPGWIGKDVLAPVKNVQYDGEPITLFAPPRAAGAELEVTVKDAAGRTIYTHAVASGEDVFTWNGETDSGEKASPGQYAVTAAVTKDGESETAALSQRGRVVEVRINDGELALGLDNGARVEASAVAAILESE